MTISTRIVTLSPSAWTSCGTGPLNISACAGSIVYHIADSQPAIGAPGYPLRVADKVVQITSTSSVWAVPAKLGGGHVTVSS